MRQTVSIHAVGAAAPSFRLAAADVAAAWGLRAGNGQVGVCAPDEDVLTLSWLAVVRALANAGRSSGEVDGLWWGTTRLPLAEGPSLAILGAALRLRSDVGGAVMSGSAHAGMEALTGAWHAVAAGTTELAVAVAADALVPGLGTAWESRAGAGAVAYVLTAADGPAALVSMTQRSKPVLDRYRGDGEDSTRDVYDARLFREDVFLPMLTDVASATGDADFWSLPDPDGRLGAVLARRLGVDASPSVSAYAEVGDAGAAAALLGLRRALGSAGRAAVVGYGGGRATGIAIEVSETVPGWCDELDRGVPVSYPEALRARRQLVASGEPVPMGVPPAGGAFVRGGLEMLALLGGRCVECGTVNVPPSVHPACIGCGADKFEICELERTGTVHTFSVNHSMPAPFVAPLPLVIVDLEDGARVQFQGLPEDASSLAVGDRVELVLRRYALERGVPVYGYKVRRIAS
ncbi:OB-fold domain-containing protein [Mycobacterium sp. CVI_P3]|uniref:OB-fold domain-containing protein n=1 Tax=Mycobacterium pinniadriaticum TaxID=2994102 RepID=A0ABT3SKZ5_9MYCO|nr:OB-fold domain-containing protein [Mycobacterium pinniadriaticum]MCX2933778.1 OB-fold domain-containing protein [Mycobacterium pinniadriaticum]MCX2940200.1 OB-fold domain-containing protein [Mycobacterium pinniadriaticum]